MDAVTAPHVAAPLATWRGSTVLAFLPPLPAAAEAAASRQPAAGAHGAPPLAPAAAAAPPPPPPAVGQASVLAPGSAAAFARGAVYGRVAALAAAVERVGEDGSRVVLLGALLDARRSWNEAT